MGIDADARNKLTLSMILLLLLLLLPLPLPTSLLPLLLAPALRRSRREGSEKATFRTVNQFGIFQHP